MHTFPNISRSEHSQKMKFGHLIEHNMKNVFLDKLNTQNLVEKLVPNPFIIKQK